MLDEHSGVHSKLESNVIRDCSGHHHNPQLKKDELWPPWARSAETENQRLVLLWL